MKNGGKLVAYLIAATKNCVNISQGLLKVICCQDIFLSMEHLSGICELVLLDHIAINGEFV